MLNFSIIGNKNARFQIYDIYFSLISLAIEV